MKYPERSLLEKSGCPEKLQNTAYETAKFMARIGNIDFIHDIAAVLVESLIHADDDSEFPYLVSPDEWAELLKPDDYTSTTENIIANGYASMTVNEKTYTVKAIPLSEITTNGFTDCNLYFSANRNAAVKQDLNLMDECRQHTLNHWLKRLLALDGIPQNLEDITAAGWTDKDMNRFVTLALKTSGLVGVKEA